MLNKIKQIAFKKQNYDLITFIENAKIYNSIETLGVNEKNIIYYNEEFVNSLSLQDAYFVFNHEFLHICYNHFNRCKELENKKVANISADILVNELLEKVLHIKIPEGSCVRTIEKSKTLNSLYDELMQNQDNQDNQPDDLQKEIQDNEELTEKQKKEIQEAINSMKDFINQKIISKNQNIIESNKKISLFDFLNSKIGRLIKYDYDRNWTRLNRYGLECIPSYRNIIYKPKIDIYIDISGSMGCIPLKIIANLKAIKNKLKNYKAKYYVFDTEITEFDINSNNVNIGGGTDIKKVLNNINNNVDLSVVLTDCEDEYINNNKKVIFISNNNKGDILVNNDFEYIIC